MEYAIHSDAKNAIEQANGSTPCLRHNLRTTGVTTCDSKLTQEKLPSQDVLIGTGALLRSHSLDCGNNRLRDYWLIRC